MSGMKKIMTMVCLLGILSGCTRNITPSEKLAGLKEIKVLEQGLINGRFYTMFYDPKTGVRILSFDQALQVLPLEKAEK